MLEVSGLEVRYKQIIAVRDLSFGIDRGSVVSVVGPNGAGKSSLLRAIAGLVSPASGRIAFEGRALHGMTPEAIVRAGIALVPEGRHIFQTLTVAENLTIGATPHRGRVPRSEVERVITLFPVLGTYYRAPAAGLSGGEQQQLALARALIGRPRLLLLDEPSLGLAPKVVNLVFDVIAQLREAGMTVLLVEQNAARAIALADHALVLRSGRLIASGTRAQLASRQDLAAAYFGQPGTTR
jgi:branched-chain amino acid transport system ATP-binding protein